MMLRIICLVKVVVEKKKCRDGIVKNILKINDEDNYALEVALRYKENNPNVHIEVVSMGPKHCQKLLEDIIRKGANSAVLISDRKFSGSDTYSTSLVLKSYIELQEFDLILTGNKTSDGDTAQIGSQIGEWLGIDQLSYVEQILIKPDSVNCIIEVDSKTVSFDLKYPVLVSCEKTVVDRPRFVKPMYSDLNVSDKFKIVDNEELKVDEKKIGIRQSPTKVIEVKENIIEQTHRKQRTITIEELTGKILDWRV